MPAARQRSSSPFMALAVTATIGVRRRPACALPRRHGSGAQAHGRPCAACGCRPVPPHTAVRGRPGLERLDAVIDGVGGDAEQLELAHQNFAVHRMIVHHQDARTRPRLRARGPTGRGRWTQQRRLSGESAGAACSISVTVNVDPTPGLLSTVTSPCISSASRRTIDRPRPVPPNRRVVEESACANGWNRRARCSSSSPMPVSATDR